MIKININILLSIMFVKLVNCLAQQSSDCDKWSQEHIYEQREPHFFNDTRTFLYFKNFSELDIMCRNLSYAVNKSLNIFAENPFLLNNNFELRNLFSNFKFPINLPEKVLFYNLNGFNFKSQNISMPLIKFNFYLYSSRFQFYLRNVEIDEETCKGLNLVHNMNFFGLVSNLFLYSDITYTIVCPYVFKDTKLNALILYQISNSLIFQNHLRFMKINETSNFDLNTQKLFYLNFNVVYYEITTNLIDKLVFRYVQRLYLAGIIYGIQSDLFDFFKEITFVFIRADNFEKFFHSGTKWISRLNKNLKVNLNNKLEFKYNIKNIILLQFYDEESFFKL